MKKLLSILTAMTFLCSVTACSERKKDNPDATENVTVAQTIYKEESFDFPEDKRFVEGISYADGFGVRLIYTDKNNCYKFADYDENMSIKSTSELFKAEGDTRVIFDCADDGTIFSLITYVHSENEIGTENYFEDAEFEYELRKYAPDGSGEEIIPLPEFGNYYNPAEDYIRGIKFIDGKILVNFSDAQLILDLSGNIIDARQESSDYIFYCTDSEGRIVASTDKGYCYMDKLSFDMPENITEYGDYLRLNLSLGTSRGYGDFKVFFMLNTGIYGLTNQDKLVEIMDYNDSLMTIADYRGLVYAGEGKFAGIRQEMEQSYLSMLTVRPDDYVMNRKDFTIGHIGGIDSIDSEMMSIYNKKSDSFKANSKVYEEFDDFTADVLTDNAPDCIAYDGTYNMRRLSNLGALTDMYQLSEEYGGFKADDILDNVRQAIEMDGKLYGIVQRFYLDVAVGRSDIFPKSNMTWNEFKEIYDNQPDDVYFSNHTGMWGQSDKQDVFNFLCNANSFIDFEKNECHFNTPEFAETLEFIRDVRLMPEMDWNSFYETHSDEEVQLFYSEDNHRITNGEALLASEILHGLNDIIEVKHKYSLNNGEYTLISPPSDKNESYICFNTCFYSVVANGKCPEGAWDYINFITSDDFLPSYLQTMDSFVTFKDSFDKINERQRLISEKPIYVDEQGVYHGHASTSKPITDEEYKNALDYISTCTVAGDSNDVIYNIMLEEYQSFMAGEKTAEKCGEDIQKRVSIYLSENS